MTVLRRRVVVAAVSLIALAVPVGSASAPPTQVEGCPRGYEKGSTIDFPQFASADANGNGLICFRYQGRSGNARFTDDMP